MSKKHYFKKDKFKDRNPDRIKLAEYVKRKNWKISEGVAKRMLDGFVIKNMNDFNNIVYSVIMSENAVPSDTKDTVPYGTPPYDKSKLTKENLMKVLKACVYYTGNVFNEEAEWIVKDKTLRVPEGSKLVIKQDVGNYGKKRYDTRGVKPEELEEIFKQLPELKDKYEVVIVDNRDDAFEIYKDINK
jgi:hypothetical protein